MAYTKNPALPRVRRQAVYLVKQGGWSTRKVARHFGYTHSAIVKWCAKDPTGGFRRIETRSSRPKKSPRALSRNVVSAIIRERVGRRRCAEHVYHALQKQGVTVSLSSVKRTLDRCHLRKKRSPWKRPHDFTERPEATFCGALLELDTIHIIAPDGSRIYIYTVIDLYSRWAYAEVVERIGAHRSAGFVRRAQKTAPFRFVMIQTDHGSEFSTRFTHRLLQKGIQHRHSRVRQKDDQAHIERFNRTIQEECLDRVRHTISSFKRALPPYLRWYNTERTHMGINYQTPLDLVPRS
ncbi:MAG TPA: integrase core domain-containing protein [Candidatus Paceibacterota bacterium]|nr:integrase core domain-containing protein [Candidatus Paceibacterota bacterium]